MATKAQHSRGYQNIPKLLLAARTEAGLSQRELGTRLRKPQSWVYNSEVGNRRIDLSEFCDWCSACDADPMAFVRRYLGTVR